MSLQHAIDELYRIAVVEAKSTSTLRLAALAQYCAEELGRRGLSSARPEASIAGGGRTKVWDVAWAWMRKYRLVISLKSILKNLGGTVPNRIDDLMGETANIQLYSPEIVTGYVMIFNVGGAATLQVGEEWYARLREVLERLAVRRAPYWTPSTFESYALLKVDFTHGAQLLEGEAELAAMFDRLVEETKLRNPGIGHEEAP